jgi:hypothetical protein
VTKKRPVGRPPIDRNWGGPQAQRAERRRFPRSAVLIFRRMLRLEADCTCQNHSCTACKQWWVEHRNLCRELQLNPWEWPCLERPGTPSPYPKGSPADRTYEPDHEAQARWGRLEQACRKAGPSVERVHLAPRPEPSRTPEMADLSGDEEP